MATHYLYALKDDADNYLYIGKTKNPITREYDHRSYTHNKCGSRDIPKDINWRMVIIDECQEEDVDRLERLYINFFEPTYNRLRPRNIQTPSICRS